MRALGKVFNNKWVFGFGILLFVLFVSAGTLTTILYSPWGRSYVLNSLNKALQESGWTFSAKKISGSLPEEMTLSDLTIASPQGDSISISSLKIELSLWRLLRNEVVFRKFDAELIKWLPEKSRTSSFQLAENKSPFTFYFPRLQIKNLFLPGKREQAVDLSGRIKIEKMNRSTYARIYVNLPEADGTILFLKRKDQKTQLKIDARLLSLDFLSSWIDQPFSGNGIAHLYVRGDWKAFQGNGPLKGIIRLNGDFRETPYVPSAEWTALSAFEYNDKKTVFSRISLKSNLLNAKGKLAFTDRDLTGASLRISVEEMGRWNFNPLEGTLLLQCSLREGHARINLSSAHAKASRFHFNGIEGNLSLDRKEASWLGSFAASGIVCGKPGDAESVLIFDPAQESLHFKDFKMNSSLLSATGDLTLSKNAPQNGLLHLKSDDLRQFLQCDPSWNFFGSATADLALKGESIQETEVDLKVSQFFYRDTKIDEGFLTASFLGTITNPTGRMYGEIQHGQWKNVFLESATLEVSSEQGVWPWKFFAQGDWNAPYEMRANGSITKNDRETSINIDHGSGSLLAHPLSFASPVRLVIAPSRFQIEPTEVTIGSGSMQFSFGRQANETRAKLLCKKVPLDLFSANPLEVQIQGFVNLNGELATVKNKTKGSLSAELTKVLISTDEEPLSASASLQATLSRNQLVFTTDASVRSKPLMHCSGSLPLDVDLNKMSAKFLPHESVSGLVSFTGRIEEVLDFFDIGPNRFEGECIAEFRIGSSFSHPVVSGALTLSNGRYENYFTGTELRSVEAHVIGKGDSLHLHSLSAKDGQNRGALSLHGELALLYHDRFPFQFDGKFSRLTVVNTEWVQADADGDVHLSGNSQTMRVSGKATIAESEITIPNRIPVPRPDLVVKYIHAPERESLLSDKNPYSVFFDYVIDAPDSIFLSGRGLSSEWKGSVVLTGSASELEMKGKYELMSGKFNFAGREFKLTEGSLLFGGKPRAFPFLNLQAQVEMQSISIIASLKGPLNNPLLSLYSSPSLPTGVVLSYLLFDEDLAELDALQAAQLLTSLASVSEGPSFVERTRKALNVDRLRIVATPIDDQGGKSYALQVGKYVTRNLLLSVSQGTQDDSTNLGIELNLGNGIIFQAESQREVEQGKFTLKWNVNY